MLTFDWYIQLVIFLLVTAGAAVFLLLQMRRQKDDEPPLCGNCGYPTCGLPTSICPECGQDLNVVGTRKPRFWNRIPARKRRHRLTLAWTIWVLWLSALAQEPLKRCGPGTRLYWDSLHVVVAEERCYVEVYRLWEIRSYCGWRGLTFPQPGQSPTRWSIAVRRDAPSPAMALQNLSPVLPVLDGVKETGEVFFADSRKDRCAYRGAITAGRTKARRAGWQKEFNNWLDTVSRKLDRPSLPKEVPAILEAIRMGPFAHSRGSLVGNEKTECIATSLGRAQVVSRANLKLDADMMQEGCDWIPDQAAGPVLTVLIWLAGYLGIVRRIEPLHRQHATPEPSAGPGNSRI